MRSILFFALLGFAIAGAPQDARRAAATNNFCAVVTKLVTIAKQQSAATAFCSSYLNIPKVTATTTLTSFSTTPRLCTVLQAFISSKGVVTARRNVRKFFAAESRVVC